MDEDPIYYARRNHDGGESYKIIYFNPQKVVYYFHRNQEENLTLLGAESPERKPLNAYYHPSIFNNFHHI